MTKTISNVELIPAKLSHVPLLILATWIVVSVTGTDVTSPTVRAGSDANHSNFFSSSSTPSSGLVNVANPESPTPGPLGPSNTLQRFPNTPVFFDITVAAAGTGGFKLKAKLAVTVAWISVGG